MGENSNTSKEDDIIFLMTEERKSKPMKEEQRGEPDPSNE